MGLHTHADKNNGQKIVDGVAYGGDTEKYDGVHPDLDVERGLEELAEGEGLGDGVPSIPVDATDDEVALLHGEESPCLVSLLGEPDKESK